MSKKRKVWWWIMALSIPIVWVLWILVSMLFRVVWTAWGELSPLLEVIKSSINWLLWMMSLAWIPLTIIWIVRLSSGWKKEWNDPINKAQQIDHAKEVSANHIVWETTMGSLVSRTFSSKWRINWWWYAFYAFWAYFVCFLIVMLLSAFLWESNIEIISYILLVPYLVVVIIWAMKRFHDMGKKSSNAFLLFVPIYNIIVGLNLLFKWWDKGDNKYWYDVSLTKKSVKVVTILLLLAYIWTMILWEIA
jgi:hypothetical protein